MRCGCGVAVLKAAGVGGDRSIQGFAELFIENFAVGDHGIHGKQRKQNLAGSGSFGIDVFFGGRHRVDAVVIDGKVDALRQA